VLLLFLAGRGGDEKGKTGVAACLEEVREI
jgi:hypothetical protein